MTIVLGAPRQMGVPSDLNNLADVIGVSIYLIYPSTLNSPTENAGTLINICGYGGYTV